MLEMCSGIYLVFAAITILLFRVTVFEARGHQKKRREFNS